MSSPPQFSQFGGLPFVSGFPMQPSAPFSIGTNLDAIQSPSNIPSLPGSGWAGVTNRTSSSSSPLSVPPVTSLATVATVSSLPAPPRRSAYGSGRKFSSVPSSDAVSRPAALHPAPKPAPPQPQEQPLETDPISVQPLPLWEDVDVVIASSLVAGAFREPSTHKLKMQRDRERRDGLMNQIEAFLLDKQEWAEREALVRRLREQGVQDITERDALVKELARNEAPVEKLKEILEALKEEEEKQCDGIRMCDQEVRALRPQLWEKENELLASEAQLADQVEDLKSTVASLQRMQGDLTSRLDRAKHQANTQMERHRAVTEQLSLANRQLEYLKSRIPAEFQQIGGERQDTPSPDHSQRPADEQGPIPTVVADPFELLDAPPMETPALLSSARTSPHTEGGTPVVKKRPPVAGMQVHQIGGVVRVLSVRPGGSAARAGLRVGDVIEAWNGVQITSKLDFTQALLETVADAPVAVRIARMPGNLPGVKAKSQTLTILPQAQ